MSSMSMIMAVLVGCFLASCNIQPSQSEMQTLSSRWYSTFVDRPDYIQNQRQYDKASDIIDVIYDPELSESDRYARLAVWDSVLVDYFRMLKSENEKQLASLLRSQGYTHKQIEQRFKDRKMIDAFKLTLENDYISHTDREYTSGTRVELSFNNLEFEKFFRELGYSHSDFYAICGQEIHTNSRPRAVGSFPEEPPKAGVLYCGAAAATYKMDAARARINMLDRFELRLGAVGDKSFAKEVQNSFHQLINQKAANWSGQLENTAYLSVSFERNVKIAESSIYGDSQPEYNIIINGNGTAGNFASHLGGEVMLNFRLIGTLIDMFVGRQSSRSTIESLRAMSMEARLKKIMCERDWGVNLFVAGGAKYVFNNSRFDAKSQGHNTEHVPLVFNVRAGVVAHYKNAMFEFAMVRNSAQWANTNGNPGDISHSYGSATITVTDEAIRDSLRWLFDQHYRKELKEKNRLIKVIRDEGIQVVYVTDGGYGSEDAFTLRCK